MHAAVVVRGHKSVITAFGLNGLHAIFLVEHGELKVDRRLTWKVAMRVALILQKAVTVMEIYQ